MPDEKKRICIVSEFFHPESETGTGKVVTDIATLLSKKHGFQVEVICSRRSYLTGEPYAAREVWNEIPIRRLNSPNWNRSGTVKRSIANLILAWKAAMALLTSGHYDAVLVTTAPPFMPLAAYWLRRLRKTPYVYIIYDLEPDRAMRLGAVDPNALPSKLLKKAQGKWLRASSKVVAIGRCMKALIQKEYAVEDGQIEVIAVGSNEPESLPPNHKNGASKFHISYSGNLGRYHDFDMILDCAKRLPEDQFQFTIVGKGAKREHVETRVRKEAIGSVTVKNPLPKAEYEKLLADTDACLVTLEDGIEGTCVPSKFYSILSAGRSTLAIANPESEIAYVLEESECGVRVSPGDSEGLFTTLMKLNEDRLICKKQGDAARRVFVEKYSTQESVAQLAAILKNVIGSKV